MVNRSVPGCLCSGALCVLLALAADARGDVPGGETAGAPDLVPVAVMRVRGGLQSSPQTPVTVRVVVANDSPHPMPRDPGNTPWTIEIQGYAGNPYRVRHALAARERHSFTVTLALPCGKVTDVEVWVNSHRSVNESDFNNDRAKFPVEGNACVVGGESNRQST